MAEMVDLSDVSISDNAKLLQVYGEGKFSTVVDGSNLFLLSTTQVSRYNVIASFDNKGHYVIYDRDKVNIFVDWSHEHYNQPGDIDKLPEHKIVGYLTSYLNPDLMKLITYTQDTTELNEVISKFNEHDRNKIQNALEKLCVLTDPIVPMTQAYTLDQVNYLYDMKLYYACFDLTRQKYDITNNGDFSKTFKNGSTGSWKQMLSSPNSYIFFFKKTDTNSLIEEKILDYLDTDVEGEPYAPANRFLELEDRFTKEIELYINRLANEKGFIQIDNIHYPNIEEYVNCIPKEILAYKKTNSVAEKAQHTSNLVNLYSNCYQELQRAQDTLRTLAKELKGIQ